MLVILATSSEVNLGVFLSLPFFNSSNLTLSTFPLNGWFVRCALNFRDVAYFTCCNGVAQGLLAHLLSTKVAAINAICLANIDIDCRELGRFAMTTGVPGLNQCFAELHELVLLATHPELSKYIDDPNIRRRNFPRLSVEKFVQLLEKIVPVPAGIHTANLFKYDKSSIKSFQKKLRAQGF